MSCNSTLIFTIRGGWVYIFERTKFIQSVPWVFWVYIHNKVESGLKISTMLKCSAIRYIFVSASVDENLANEIIGNYGIFHLCSYKSRVASELWKNRVVQEGYLLQRTCTLFWVKHCAYRRWRSSWFCVCSHYSCFSRLASLSLHDMHSTCIIMRICML